MGTRIVGYGKALPGRVVTNDDLVARGFKTSDQWIVEHTGIKERRVCCRHETVETLAAIAASGAISDAGIKPQDVGYTIVATSTATYSIPAAASIVQGAIGCGGGAADVNSGCSGFVQALGFGFGLQRIIGRPVVVIGADAYSKFMTGTDRLANAFFGDGAGAVVLADDRGKSHALKAFSSGSDGTNFGALHAELAQPLAMNGRAVWEFVMGKIPPLVRELSIQVGVSLERMTFVPHQANAIMLAELAAKSEVPQERMFLNVQRYGNMAAASVPVALEEARQEGKLTEHTMIAAFGAGLAWAGAVIEVDL